MPNKPGAGRPPKYRKDFHPQDFVKLCEQGKTKAQIAHTWGVAIDTLADWGKNHKEFSEAVRLGRAAAKDFWTQLAFAAMINQATFNGRPVTVDYRYFNWIMMNCFGFGKEKRPLALSEELTKLFEMAKELKKLSQSELIKLAEKDLGKLKK